MKRLMKKSNSENIDFNVFFDELLMSNEFNYQEIDQLIQDNVDCTHNGKAYRALFFENDEIENLTKSYYDKGIYSEEELTKNVIRDLLIVDGSYQSFSRTSRGAKYFADNDGTDNYSSKVIISSDIQNGLDIGKLHAKYFDTLNSYVQGMYKTYENEEEILAPLSNYEIEDDEEIREIIYDVIQELEF